MGGGGARVVRIIVPKRMFKNFDDGDDDDDDGGGGDGGDDGGDVGDDNKKDDKSRRVPKTPPGKPREKSSRNKPLRSGRRRQSHNVTSRRLPLPSPTSFSTHLPCNGRPYQYIDPKTKQQGTVLSALGGHILQKYYMEQHKPKVHVKRSVPKSVGQSKNKSSFMSSYMYVKKDNTKKERSGTIGVKAHKRRDR